MNMLYLFGVPFLNRPTSGLWTRSCTVGFFLRCATIGRDRKGLFIFCFICMLYEKNRYFRLAKTAVL